MAEGYKEIGEYANLANFRFGVKSVDVPQTIEFTSGNRSAPSGRKWLNLRVRFENHRSSDVYLELGQDFILDTDAGVTFGYNLDVFKVAPGYWQERSLTFDVPQNANVAVLAMRPLVTTTGDNNPVLWRIPIPQ